MILNLIVKIYLKIKIFFQLNLTNKSKKKWCKVEWCKEWLLGVKKYYKKLGNKIIIKVAAMN